MKSFWAILFLVNFAFAQDALQVLPVQGNIYMIAGAGGNITLQTGTDGNLLVDTGLAPLALPVREDLIDVAAHHQPAIGVYLVTE